MKKLLIDSACFFIVCLAGISNFGKTSFKTALKKCYGSDFSVFQVKFR